MYFLDVKLHLITYFPSEADAMAGQRPAVAWSVRKALLQKIDLKKMSYTRTSQKESYVPFCSDHLHEDYIEKKFVPKTQVTQVGKSFSVFQKNF